MQKFTQFNQNHSYVLCETWKESSPSLMMLAVDFLSLQSFVLQLKTFQSRIKLRFEYISYLITLEIICLNTGEFRIIGGRIE
jgi:hypothetical protein